MNRTMTEHGTYRHTERQTDRETGNVHTMTQLTNTEPHDAH